MAIKATELWQGIQPGMLFTNIWTQDKYICRWCDGTQASFWFVTGGDVFATEPIPIEDLAHFTTN